MLRSSLRALHRAAAQLTAACSTSAEISASGTVNMPVLAAAMHRLHLQQPNACNWRHFSSSGGSGGEQPPAAPPAAAEEGQQTSAAHDLPAETSQGPAAAAGAEEGEVAVAQQDGESDEPTGFRSATGRFQFEKYDDALEAWGQAMDKGDWGAAWDIFEGVAPVDTDEFPALEELLAWDPDEDQKRERRQREESIKEMHAARWVRRVDPTTGRAYGVGKRKTSVALVWIKPGPGHMMINKRPYDAYFPDLLHRNDLLAPFLVTDTLGCFDVMVRVSGGGQTGQSQAVRHGLARALQNWEPALRPYLKAAGLLTRDARIVERKKPGLKKARKAFQWVKR